MRKIWFDEAWEDYLWWQQQDKKILKKINTLIKDIERGGYDGIGNPEALKNEFEGFWSRRIDNEHRLIYRVVEEVVEILSCKGHYND